MENTQTGKVLIIGQTYQVPSTDPNAQPFYKRELVLDCTRYNPINGNKIENYPKFEFINNNCPMLDGLQVGQLVTVSFSLSGRKSVKDGRENYFTNITGYNDSIVFDYAPRLLREGVDVKKASKNDIINAVENVISDELALELAFEGYRFSDLVRMANHKNASGYDGSAWLAAKIADRDVQGTNGTRDAQLYNKLLTPSNWYLTKPAWSGNK